jgi:hypothetical protein
MSQGLRDETVENNPNKEQVSKLWIILKWIFRRWDVGVWTGLIRFWIGTGGGHL